MDDVFNGFLLQLYRSAGELPVELFPPFMLGLAKGVLAFDSGQVRRGPADDLPSSARCESDSVSAHRISGAYATGGNGSGPVTAITFFRIAEKPPFDDHERAVCNTLVPHLAVALAINRQAMPVDTDDGEAIALVDGYGRPEFCTGGFRRLVAQFRPAWDGGRLPDELMPDPEGKGDRGPARVGVVVTRSRIGSITYLKATILSPVSRLSEREMSIARKFGGGLSYKEIARELGLAPNTVRTVIRNIYLKLKIRDKAALATLINGH